MSESFQWTPEYNDILERIAASDQVDSGWGQLRKIIKYKLDQNVSQYLESPIPDETTLAHAASMATPKSLPMGGLKLPPFPPRVRLEGNPNEAPKHVLTPEEAKQFKEVLFRQLDDFEGAPFTIQRVCELCLNPSKHYKFVGKYLRAVEKALLVTSTWDAFPISTSEYTRPSISTAPISSTAFSTPSTPLFSPIPFLHGDARRSHSRSPPPSPLALAALGAGASMTATPHAGAEDVEKVIGLVDELDDPSPGHLSDHPQPISATTTAVDSANPIYKSLEARFTKGSEGKQDDGGGSAEAAGESSSGDSGEGMILDEEGSEDKENKDA